MYRHVSRSRLPAIALLIALLLPPFRILATTDSVDDQRLAEAKTALAKYKDCAAATSALNEVSSKGRRSVAWIKLMAQADVCVGNLSSLLKARSLYQLALKNGPNSAIEAAKADVDYRIRKLRHGGTKPAEPVAVAATPSSVPSPVPVVIVETPSPTPTPCDPKRLSYPDDPAGRWTDGGPANITNKCECVEKGIRVVGVKFGAFNNIIPAFYLQIFNTSGERRTIWSDVKLAWTGWQTTNAVVLRGEERQGFQLVGEHRGDDRITDVIVLGCGT